MSLVRRAVRRGREEGVVTDHDEKGGGFVTDERDISPGPGQPYIAGPDFPYVLVVGFKAEPEGIYQAIEALGGEVLQESEYDPRREP